MLDGVPDRTLDLDTEIEGRKVGNCRRHTGWHINPRTGVFACSCGRPLHEPEPEPEPVCECHVVRMPPCWACSAGLISWD